MPRLLAAGSAAATFDFCTDKIKESRYYPTHFMILGIVPSFTGKNVRVSLSLHSNNTPASDFVDFILTSVITTLIYPNIFWGGSSEQSKGRLAYKAAEHI